MITKDNLSATLSSTDTWHLHIKGQVQGVGFRPFVYLLAKRHGLHGWVNNSTDGVHIEINAHKDKALQLLQEIKTKAPKLSRITEAHLVEIEKKFFDQFQIIHSNEKSEPNLLLTPDVALCDDCRTELYSENNRRASYPFITCTNCGPRYSIMHQLPYDRQTTSMDTFTMCNLCKTEYADPKDRRYFSQTNSCPDCSIEMSLFGQHQKKINIAQAKLVDYVSQLWQLGNIVAIKGIGGYLLTCDASQHQAIALLRKRKNRPTKPFALMFPDVSCLKKVATVKECELVEMRYLVAPILLLDMKEDAGDLIATDKIAPGLNKIGAMLPYTPLFDLLLNKFKKPIVSTSGNLSNSPIIYQDDNALKELSEIADFVLTNNRNIVVPQDDSVIQYTPFKSQKIIMRRSRGLAPTYINARLIRPDKTILATGAMLKSTFCFSHRENIFISQYLGDLEDFNTEENYKHTVEHFFELFKSKPEMLLCDKHPEYPSTQLGQEMSDKLTIPLEKIQHHLAHFGAVLAENNLLPNEEPILGVIWDGTGLGDDGQIWGGEFFIYKNHNFKRLNHFKYFDFILGDKMPKEPRISALSACWGIPGIEDVLKDKFSETEWQVYTNLLGKKNNLKTSSVGRIFDAVASLLGIMDKQTFEGEAAMRLEEIALCYFKKNGLESSISYLSKKTNYDQIQTQELMTNIILDIKRGKSVEFIAAMFHCSLMEAIAIVARKSEIKKIALSGGVFQNSLLVDLIIHHLDEDFDLFFHKELPPNDENVSFGQLVCHQIQQQNTSNETPNKWTQNVSPLSPNH
jgi:hydrogenase maturation protein HypF